MVSVDLVVSRKPFDRMCFHKCIESLHHNQKISRPNSDIRYVNLGLCFKSLTSFPLSFINPVL